MIHHIYSTKETIQKFPGIKPYKESWFITEKFQNHKAGTIIAAVNDKDEIIKIEDFDIILQNLHKTTRRLK